MRVAGILSAFGLIAGCATQPVPQSLPQVEAWLAAGGAPPPPVSTCPFVAQVDLGRIAAEQARSAQEDFSIRSEAYYRELFDAVEITGAAPGPSPDALVVLTGVEPPGGMYLNTVWSVVWKEPDGQWRFWRQNRTNDPPPPPPPPPGPNASAEARAAYEAELVQYPPPDDVRWPPVHGLLSPGQVASVERSLADPCRAWEPDRWPWDPPLRRVRAQPAPPHPHDWTPFYVWIEEKGRPARLIVPPNMHDTHVGVIHGVAAYPRS